MLVHWLKAGWVLLGGTETHEEQGEPPDVLWEERCSGEKLVWNLEPKFPPFGKEKIDRQSSYVTFRVAFISWVRHLRVRYIPS